MVKVVLLSGFFVSDGLTPLPSSAAASGWWMFGRAAFHEKPQNQPTLSLKE